MKQKKKLANRERTKRSSFSKKDIDKVSDGKRRGQLYILSEEFNGEGFERRAFHDSLDDRTDEEIHLIRHT